MPIRKPFKGDALYHLFIQVRLGAFVVSVAGCNPEATERVHDVARPRVLL